MALKSEKCRNVFKAVLLSVIAGFVFYLLFFRCLSGVARIHTGPVVLVEVKPPRVRGARDPKTNTWHADFDVIFEGNPIHLSAEFKQVYSAPIVQQAVKSMDWEQTGNIVTLRFEFTLLSIEQRMSSIGLPLGKLILEREHQKKSVEVVLTWADGRRTFTVEADPPQSLFVRRSDIFSFQE